MSHILQTGCVNLLKPRPRPAEPFLHGLNAVCTLPQQTRHTLYRPLKTILRYGFKTFIGSAPVRESKWQAVKQTQRQAAPLGNLSQENYTFTFNINVYNVDDGTSGCSQAKT